LAWAIQGVQRRDDLPAERHHGFLARRLRRLGDTLRLEGCDALRQRRSARRQVSQAGSNRRAFEPLAQVEIEEPALLPGQGSQLLAEVRRLGPELDFAHANPDGLDLELRAEDLGAPEEGCDRIPDDLLERLRDFPAPATSPGRERVAPRAAIHSALAFGVALVASAARPAPQETAEEVEPGGRTSGERLSVSRQLSLRRCPQCRIDHGRDGDRDPLRGGPHLQAAPAPRVRMPGHRVPVRMGRARIAWLPQ
jgi:hypothetical protein